MPLGGLLTAGAIGGGISSLGGLIGQIAGQGQTQQQMAAQQAALQQILGVDAPTAQQLMATLSKENVAGTMSPTAQGTVTEGPSAFASISTNPQLRQAQMQALQSLQGLGNTGLTAQDRAALMQIAQQTSGQAQALNKSVLANAAQRGMAGSGASLAAQLAGAQGAANTGAQQGLNVASQAQQKALQAMSNAGALGSQMEGQQFGEAAQQAAAADAISRFNAANAQNVLGQNTQAQNQAQLYNLENAQNVANTNTNITNQQALQNVQAQQQAYQDALNKASDAAKQYGNIASQYGTQAQQQSNMWSGLGQGLGSMATAGLIGSNAFGTSNSDEQAPPPVTVANNSAYAQDQANASQGPTMNNGGFYTGNSSVIPSWYSPSQNNQTQYNNLGNTGPINQYAGTQGQNNPGGNF